MSSVRLRPNCRLARYEFGSFSFRAATRSLLDRFVIRSVEARVLQEFNVLLIVSDEAYADCLVFSGCKFVF